MAKPFNLHILFFFSFSLLLHLPCQLSGYFSSSEHIAHDAEWITITSKNTESLSNSSAVDVNYLLLQIDSVQLQAVNCQSLTEYCLEIELVQLDEFAISINNNVLNPSDFITCNGNQAALLLPSGDHQLIIEEIASSSIDTIVVSVICSETESINVDLKLNETDTICLSNDELFSEIVTIENACINNTFVNYEFISDSCIVVTGILVGEETACLVACDALNFCDTTIVHLSVEHPFPNGIRDSIFVNGSGNYCFNEQLLNIVGAIDTFENICTNSSGANVNFNLDPINHCIFYDGISIGSDIACIRICDASGNCDTINYAVEVFPGNVELDTVFISVDTGTYCIDEALLPGDIILVHDECHENNGQQVIFEIEGSCVNYYGTNVGQDTACLRIEDNFGNVALIDLIVSVKTTTPEKFISNIFIGEINEFCLDTFELPGNYQDFEIIFDDDNPANVSFDENLVNLCVRYEGLQVGQDSFRIALCDHYGFCDTTTLCITVVPYFEPPGLTADSSTTFKETPVVLDPISNDTVFGGVDDFFILIPPISGSAVINLDGSVTYVPNPPFCARWDEFSYVVCNPIGCDTTTVSVFIECVELTIFNAVSPNNDDVNDYFYIAKIENFPNNRLWIYNRWGNQVFDSGSEGYKNNWPGTWGDDIDLTDGTYYYVLEWTDNGITTVQRGYFEMFR